MPNRENISALQLMILVIMNVVGTSILAIPYLITVEAKRDAWLAAILALAASMPVVWLYLKLFRRFPTMTLAQVIEEVFGKWFGKAIALFFFLAYPFYFSFLTLRNIGDFLTTQMMPETPIEVIHIVFMLAVIYGVRLGLEPIARAAEILLPVALFMLLLMMVFVSPQIKWMNMLPILESGFKPVISASIPFIGFPLLETIIFLMILPNVNEPEKVGKMFISGIVIGWTVLFILTFLAILVLGADLASRNVFPSFSLAKKISVGHFIERVEVTIAIAWFVTSFFRICTYLYVALLGIAQTFNMKDYRYLITPLGLIMVVYSIASVPNTPYLMRFDLKILPLYNFTISLLLPLSLLLVAFARKKGPNEKLRDSRSPTRN